MSFRLRLILPLLTLLLLLPVAAGCDSSPAGSGSTAGNSSATKVAPDFSVQTIMGATTDYSDLKGKPLVLNFAASWCGPCEQEAPVLAAMYDKYKDRVNFMGMAVKDTPDDQRAFAQKHGLKFTIGLDPKGDILYNYQKTGKLPYSGIPTTFFIDKDGNIDAFFIGPLSESTFETKLATILK